MFKRIWLVFVSICVLVLIGCGGTPDTDLAHDIEPVRDVISAKHISVLGLLGVVTEESRWDYLNRNWPNLTRNLIAYKAVSTETDSVVYYFGSMSTSAQDGKGKIHRGKLYDELVALVYTSDKKPKAFIVRCLNQMFDRVDKVPKNLQRLGVETPSFEFEIGPGEDLRHHVDSETAILIAENFDLPLFSGTSESLYDQEITPDKARRIISKTDYTQITAKVSEGDELNLGDWTFMRKGRITDQGHLRIVR
ncbi:MAG: hypothetical protein V1853_04815 [bacterium]